MTHNLPDITLVAIQLPARVNSWLFQIVCLIAY